jgi:hypothetical protein
MITNFTEWWKVNSTEYEKAGVNKIVAHSIWKAACDAVETTLIEKLT